MRRQSRSSRSRGRTRREVGEVEVDSGGYEKISRCGKEEQ